jgi:putative ABC transport system ATP-binding protein
MSMNVRAGEVIADVERLNDAIVDVDRVGIEFGGNWILRDQSLSIRAGNRIAVVGPSGSGKTILLRSIALLHPASEGEIRWHSKPVGGSRTPKFRRHVMYLPQRVADADGSVEEFLAAPFSFAANQDLTWDRDAAVLRLQMFQRKADFLDKDQRDLSGGERQILSLTRAFLLQPEVLLLDEPTSAMDSSTVAIAEQLIADWIAESDGRAIVLVTHDMSQANRLTDSTVRL